MPPTRLRLKEMLVEDISAAIRARVRIEEIVSIA
jgi:hypothetical protein